MTQGEAPPLVGGRYLLQAVLQQGNNGTLWRAEDTALGRPVALKEVSPPVWLPEEERAARVARTLRTAEALSRVSHQCVAAVHSVVAEGERSYLVMELVDGPSLEELVREQGPLPAARVARIGLLLMDALEAVHEHGLVHGDLRPAAVMLTPAGVPKLVGFAFDRVAGGIEGGEDAGSPSPSSPSKSLVRKEGDTGGGQQAAEQIRPEDDFQALWATLWFAAEGLWPRADTLGAAAPLPPPRQSGQLGRALHVLLGGTPLPRSGARQPSLDEARVLLRACTVEPVEVGLSFGDGEGFASGPGPDPDAEFDPDGDRHHGGDADQGVGFAPEASGFAAAAGPAPEFGGEEAAYPGTGLGAGQGEPAGPGAAAAPGFQPQHGEGAGAWEGYGPAPGFRVAPGPAAPAGAGAPGGAAWDATVVMGAAGPAGGGQPPWAAPPAGGANGSRRAAMDAPPEYHEPFRPPGPQAPPAAGPYGAADAETEILDLEALREFERLEGGWEGPQDGTVAWAAGPAAAPGAAAPVGGSPYQTRGMDPWRGYPDGWYGQAPEGGWPRGHEARGAPPQPGWRPAGWEPPEGRDRRRGWRVLTVLAAASLLLGVTAFTVVARQVQPPAEGAGARVPATTAASGQPASPTTRPAAGAGGGPAPVTAAPTTAAPTTAVPPTTAAPTTAPGGASVAVVLEAESPRNILANGALPLPCLTCSGGVRVGHIGGNGTLRFNGVTVPADGTYLITVNYTAGEERTLQLLVNDSQRLEVRAGSTGAWDAVAQLQLEVQLRAGENTLLFHNTSGGAPDIDVISITRIG